MSQNEFTKGPIVVDQHGEEFFLTAERSATDVEAVGVTYKRADAVLFSASLEMLEALKLAGPQLEVLHRHYSGQDAAAIYKIIGVVSSAISKAEGRA